MPVEDEEKIKQLVSQGKISAVSLDTNVFDSHKLNFSSPSFRALERLPSIPFSVVISSTVKNEVQRHIEKAASEALRNVKEALGHALFVFGTMSPSRDEMLSQVTGGRNPADIADKRLRDFIKNTNAYLIDDTRIVATSAIFSAYFDGKPPFKRGKKTEFPDALALFGLEQAAVKLDTRYLIVSEDRDWRDFCEESKHLYIVDRLEKALAIIQSAPIALRRSVLDWLGRTGEGRDVLRAELTEYVETRDVDAYAFPSSGEVDIEAWSPELVDLVWPSEVDIDIIEIGKGDVGTVLTVTVPLTAKIKTTLDLAFSIWDSVDRESVPLAGRSVELEKSKDILATIVIKARSVAENKYEFEIESIEYDLDRISVSLGEVDIFEFEEPDYE